ncbi:hypothetical protein [Streptomyces odontomachi]|uniref:hypothetical protein n=1 Tax=Streptomyces odontomachi TaxID=2944940 RepID=UPI0021095B84|nr:hypothetical protein [Streptomyces sp. ODS25]
MVHAARSRTESPLSSLFSTDGKPHPVQDTLLVVTVLLGATAAISSIFSNLHVLSSWTGLVGIITGGYGQYISETTRERFGLVIGLGAAGLGLFLGIAHGGPFGGLVG